jgi:hypothetical protein
MCPFRIGRMHNVFADEVSQLTCALQPFMRHPIADVVAYSRCKTHGYGMF